MQGRNLTWFVAGVICCFLFSACAHDTYQQRADVIKDHTEAFYTHLKANRVESALSVKTNRLKPWQATWAARFESAPRCKGRPRSSESLP
jgi:hypothetical protein